MLFERAAVIGIGLIGGSLALATKRQGLVGHVVGVARRENTLLDALRVGAADTVTNDPAQAVRDADLVYLATPVRAIPPLLAAIAPHLPAGCLVTDGGSTKRAIVQAAGALPASVTFIGGHPMTGSELSGPGAADRHLFEGSNYFLTPTDETPADDLARLIGLVEGIGARPTLVDAATHDRVLAATSHLPHLVAAALCNALVSEDKPERFAGPGLRDTTRIAGGPANVWRDILLENAEDVREAMARLREVLDSYDAALADADGDALVELLERARDTREGLEP